MPRLARSTIWRRALKGFTRLLTVLIAPFGLLIPLARSWPRVDAGPEDPEAALDPNQPLPPLPDRPRDESDS